MLQYDNLDDVKQKLYGTLVYYDGKIGQVMECKTSVQGGFSVCLAMPHTNKHTWVNLEDPKLNYTEYNLGYSNYDSECVWWCRIPLKQWQQGLKQNQCRWKSSKDGFNDLMPNIGFYSHTFRMLLNDYPPISSVMVDLKNGMYRSRAFHKDFALKWNYVHGDFILDYKGQSIGHFKTPDEVTFIPGFEHMAEAVKEVVG